MAFPTYPATTLDQGVDLVIFSSNQLHDVINGSATETVETESGLIPTLRKALLDNFYFKSPVAWAAGSNETVFNQLRFFQNGILSGYYYAPTATTANPIPMQGTPVGDNNWVLWSMKTEQLANEVYPWLYTGATGYEKVISPPYIFDSAIVTINGVVQIIGDAYTIEDSKIILSEPLGLDPATGLPNKLFAYIGKIVATADTDPNMENRVTALEASTSTLTTQMSKVPLQAVARKYGLKDGEVGYAQSGQVLTGIKALYDPVSQVSYVLPVNMTGTFGALSTTGVLTYSGGTVDLGALAVELGNYNHKADHFGKGATLNARNDTIGLGAKRYRWGGTLPKTISDSDTLASSGGVSPTTWIEVNAEMALGKAGASLQAWNDVIHIRDYTAGTPYANATVAVQAALTAAKNSESKVLDARGWYSGRLTVDKLVAENITILGGKWEGDRDFWMYNCTFDGMTIQDMRIMPKGGNNRILNTEFNGHPRQGQTATICFQHLEYYDQTILPNGTAAERASAAGDTDAGTFEIDTCVFRGGYFGILQQPSGGKITKAVFRNLSFYDMMGDAIELNVVQKSFDNGCVIENIAIFGIDSDVVDFGVPNFVSNWGIGIGLAGKSPYGYEIADSQYVHNFTIRNVYAERVRQVVHVEVGRNFTISNIHAGADNTVSTRSGLSTATVYVVGSKDFMIDGVYGEPVPKAGVQANQIRTVMLQWGTNQIFQPDGSPYNPPRAEQSNSCFNYTVRNIHTKTGTVWAGASSGKNTKCTAVFDNIYCDTFKIFGIASVLTLSNITCKTFDGVGQPDSGDGAFPDGFVRSDETYLNMTNVVAIDDNGRGGQYFSRCRYTHIYRSGGNVATQQYVNFLGSLGTLLGTAGNVFYPIEAAHGANGTRFPTGYEFNVGDTVLVMERAQIWRPKAGATDPRNPANLEEATQYVTTPFTVMTAGVFIPDTKEAEIKAAAVGTTQLVQNLTPNGTSSGSPWLYVCQFSPGCRITIPGAGANGADLNTTVVKPPYQTPPSDTGAPITMDIADPIQTAVPAGTRIRATTPLTTRPSLQGRSAYYGIAE